MAPVNKAASVAGKSFLCPLLTHALLATLSFSRIRDSFTFFLAGQAAFAVLFGLIFWAQHRRSPLHVGISLRSLLLGVIFTLGIQLVLVAFNLDSPPISSVQLSFGLYLVLLTVFHYTEFLTTALNQPNSVSTEAFLLNHSPEYHLALLISLAEFSVESYFLPDVKFRFPLLLWIGFAICCTGEAIRKVAMFTAGRNFTHIIADEHQPEHFLVTEGIYGIWRHPSYVGWFYWSIGTQILLLNPLSFLGYTVVSWRFFRQRVYYEEMTLARFFGAKYIEYKRTVPSGLPFIDGF